MSLEETGGRRLRVAVLMGGASSERAVSLSTGKMIVSALDPARYEVTAMDTQEMLALLPRAQTTLHKYSDVSGSEPRTGVAAGASSAPFGSGPPDVVFIALHGKGGEDGAVQGMLDFLGLPYTGSGVLASALAMDKAMAKRLFRGEGIPVVEDVAIRRGQGLTDAEIIARVQEKIGFPVFVKPNAEGSTFGCTLVATPATLPVALANALRYDTLALIERYVQGVEITVGVLDDGDGPQPLPVIEIVPKAVYYDYESKYADGGSEHLIPAHLPEPLQAEAQALAVRCHSLLGCDGMSRTDMIVRDGQIFVLEVNTIPGMTPTSLLPQAAAYAGVSFPNLLDRLIAAALRSRVTR